MTREEAIAVLAESKRQNEVMRDNPSTFWASHQMADGVKNAKRRIEALDVALSALRPVSREQVEKAWRGEWKHYLPPLGAGDVQCRCTRCGRTPDVETPFCAWCGAPMTDETVQMVMERLEATNDKLEESC